MSSRLKTTLIMTIMFAVTVISIVAIIAIFAAKVQTFNSNISVTFICKDVNGSASAKYYVGSKDVGTAMRVDGKPDGATTVLFRPEDETINATLKPVATSIDLTKENEYAVFEYCFTNGPSSVDYSAEMYFTGTTKNVNVYSTTQDAPITDFSQISSNMHLQDGESQTFSYGVVIPHKEDGDEINKKYFYIKAEIKDKGKDAEFSGSFVFNINLAEPYHDVQTSNLDLGVVQAYKSNENIEIYATPRGDASVVGVKDKATGEWVSINISKSKTKFVLNSTSGQYEVVFSNTERSTSSGQVNYKIFSDADIAVVNSINQISLTAVVEPNESTKTVSVESSVGGGYSVKAIVADAITQGGYILSLPNSIVYVDENAFNLKNDDLIAISANQTVLDKINAPFKVSLKNKLHLTHNAVNTSRPGHGVQATIYYDYNVVLSTSSNVNCFTLYYKGELTGEEDKDVSVNKEDSMMLFGKNANANYNLKVANNKDDTSLQRMVESESIKVGGVSLYTTEGGTKSHLTDMTTKVERIFNNAVQNGKDIDISFVYNYSTDSDPCFIEGSLITLANGQAKPIEDITYDDLLLVWDFDAGRYAASYPVWITKTLQTEEYYKITFDDGSVFYNVVAHRLYSTDTNYFEKSVDATNSQIGHNFFAVNTYLNGEEKGNAIKDASGNITFKNKRIVNIELKTEHKTYYNLITGYSMNVFVNSILASTGMSNMYGSTPDMKYDPEKVAERQQDSYTFEELDVPAHYYYGLRLGEQKTVREIPDINKYVAIDMKVERPIPQVVENGVSYNNWIVSTSDDDVFSSTFVPKKVREGGTYTLAQPKNTQNFVGWYCSADGKIYHAGDSVTIRMGTYFTAIYSN